MVRAAGIALVLILAGMQLSFSLPDLWRVKHAVGYTGMGIVGRSVLAVHPGGPATKAGRKLESGVIRPIPVAPYPKVVVALRILAQFIWISLAALLVVRRPSVMTWAFFVFSLGQSSVASGVIAPAIYPEWYIVAHHAVTEIASILGDAAAVVFVLSLGAKPLPSWRRAAAIAVGLLLVAVNASYMLPDLELYLAHRPPSGIPGWYANLGTVIAALFVSVALILVYDEVRGKDRQRVAWAAAGVGAFYAISLIGVGISFVPSLSADPAATIAGTTLLGLSIVTPLCVAYAVLKHHLVDLNFVVSRTLVFGTISLLVLAIFASIDWLFTKQLDAHGLGTIVEIVAATAIGFSFRKIHERVELIVDSLFFRKRHQAEEHLRQVARALPAAASISVVEKALADEPFETLELASVALFRKRGNSPNLYRYRAEGWHERTSPVLASTDVLFLELQAERRPLKLHGADQAGVRFPIGPAMPELALPLFVEGELALVAFYGAHRQGEHLAADEINAIGSLAVGAEAALTQLTAKSMRDEVQAREREINELKREVELLRGIASTR